MPFGEYLDPVAVAVAAGLQTLGLSSPAFGRDGPRQHDFHGILSLGRLRDVMDHRVVAQWAQEKELFRGLPLGPGFSVSPACRQEGLWATCPSRRNSRRVRHSAAHPSPGAQQSAG